MSRSPSISVIIPVYNAEKYVAEAVASVRRQGYESLEIIVINDGSTDDSLMIIESLGDDIIILNQANSGPAAARNKGLAAAGGEIIAFLDADDLWPDNKLAHQYAYLLTHPQCDIVWGRTQYFGDLGDREEKIPLDQDKTAVTFQLGVGLFRRITFDRVGILDEKFRYSEDIDWLLRAREIGVTIDILDDIVLLYRIHQESMVHAMDNLNFQLPLLLKKSLDRRRIQGEFAMLPKLPGTKDLGKKL